MPSYVEGGPCESCAATFTRATSWSGNADYKYCHKRGCIRLGKEAGHITERAAKKQKLAGVDTRVFDSVHMELLEAGYIASTRFFAAGALDGEVAASNEVPEEERVLQLLVYGLFKRDEKDLKGAWAHYWMDPEQLQESEHISSQRVQELRTAFRAEEDRLWAAE